MPLQRNKADRASLFESVPGYSSLNVANVNRTEGPDPPFRLGTYTGMLENDVFIEYVYFNI